MEDFYIKIYLNRNTMILLQNWMINQILHKFS